MSRNIAIFASGNGTNAENIIKYFSGNKDIKVKIVMANKADAFVLERAHRLGIPTLYINREQWADATHILTLLHEQQIDFIVLAGFLARIPDALLHSYPNRIVNIHPSLLPKFGGKGMYGNKVHEAVVAAGETESGITIHYLNEHYDEGQIIAQYRCPVMPNDTPQDVATRVHALEYEYYPKVIEQLLTTLSATDEDKA